MYVPTKERDNPLGYQQSQYYRELAYSFDFWNVNRSLDGDSESHQLAREIVQKYFEKRFRKRYEGEIYE